MVIGKLHKQVAWISGGTKGIGEGTGDRLARIEADGTRIAAVVTGGAGQVPTSRDVGLAHRVNTRDERTKGIRFVIGQEKVGPKVGAELKAVGRAIEVGLLLNDDGAAGAGERQLPDLEVVV